jgi:thiamine kinase-like enzyme
MKQNNPAIQKAVRTCLENIYGLSVSSLSFIPQGRESYVYRVDTKEGTSYLVKYNYKQADIRQVEIVNTLLSRISYFPFVVPPVSIGSQTSARVLDGIVTVFPFIEGNAIEMGNDKFDEDLVSRITEMLADIHTWQPSRDLTIPTESFTSEYSRMMDYIEKHISKKDPFFSLFQTNRQKIQRIIDRYQSLETKYAHNKPKFVLTHGDVTGLNFIVLDDSITLIDWDDAMLAPPERDLMFIQDNKHFDAGLYKRKTGHAMNLELVKYYQLRWSLDSIVGNFDVLVQHPGLDDDDKQESLREIEEYLGYYE